MLDLSCRSSSSCPSPPRIISRSIAVDNELHKTMSPRLSSLHSGPLELDKTFPDEASIYWDSEKALGSSSMNSIASNDTPTTKSSVELRKEIAILEVEIMYLESRLLSLYRTAFEERLPALSNNTKTHKVSSPTMSENKSRPKLEPLLLKGSSFYDQTSPTMCKTMSTKLHLSQGRKSLGSGNRSLAAHLGVSHLDGTLDTPDRLSEQMVRCISSIYCKVADPSQIRANLLASPTSSLSSSSIFSSHNPCDSWSPYCNEDAAVNTQLQVLKTENSEQRYGATVEVLKICLDNNSFSYAATMLQNFRSMVGSLEKVDPSKMKREQKLAFWINIHNALVMHAYLAYGIQDRAKSTSILKAAYNVGGQHVDAYIIQSSILGIRSQNPSPWLQSLFSPGKKPKSGITKHIYALEYSEPLVHFALCSGAYSDPVVRVYTAKSIFHDLKLAQEEFIQANVTINKETKVLLPKMLDCFAKDMSINVAELLELVNGCFSEDRRNGMVKCRRMDKYVVQWLPQNSAFRFVIHGELAKSA